MPLDYAPHCAGVKRLYAAPARKLRFRDHFESEIGKVAVPWVDTEVQPDEVQVGPFEVVPVLQYGGQRLEQRHPATAIGGE